MESLGWSFGQDSHCWAPTSSGLDCFPRLPAGVISEQGLREEVPPILQHHILKVALELPTSKFSWLKAQVGRGCGPQHTCGLAGRSPWVRTLAGGGVKDPWRVLVLGRHAQSGGQIPVMNQEACGSAFAN